MSDSVYNPSLAYYSCLMPPSPSKHRPKLSPPRDGGRLTACTVAVGESIGMDLSEIIQVTATGEVTLPPDHCRLAILVSGSKEHVQDVKNSVARRLDYILQTLRNYQIKDVEVSQNLRRVNGLFQLEAEVIVKIYELNKYQLVCNLLTEKLDEHVKLSQPELFPSDNKLNNIRTKASLLAVENCKQKAGELAKAVGARIGRVLAIKEMSCVETEGSVSVPVEAMTMQQRIEQATTRITATINVTFELKGRGKNRKD